MRISWRAIVIPVSALLVWELASHTGLMDLEFLSRPSSILIAGISGIADGTFLYATWQTLEAALFGLSIALVAGVLVGIFLGLSRFRSWCRARSWNRCVRSLRSHLRRCRCCFSDSACRWRA